MLRIERGTHLTILASSVWRRLWGKTSHCSLPMTQGSLSSFERYEHHDTVVSLSQLDGMWCKDPLIEADLPTTKQSCGLPTQRDEHMKFGGQIKSPRCDDFTKNVIVLLWVDDPGHKRDGLHQEPKVNLIPLFKKKKKKLDMK